MIDITSPWQVQIAMLPIRRKNPDDKRNQETSARARAGRANGVAQRMVVQAGNRERILHLLRKGPARINDICRKTDLSRETVRTQLAALEAYGLVEQRAARGPWRAL